jgi:hypothetical protein
MNQICAKIYYLIDTGEVLIITPECQGSVEPTTKEKDMEIYEQLKSYSIDEVDFLELEYGTLAYTFNNAKAYKVSLKTKQLDVVYYTKEELTAIQEQYQQNQQSQDLNSRVSDIAIYLNNSNEDTIADIENSILEIEKNKIKWRNIK